MDNASPAAAAFFAPGVTAFGGSPPPGGAVI